MIQKMRSESLIVWTIDRALQNRDLVAKRSILQQQPIAIGGQCANEMKESDDALHFVILPCVSTN